MPLVNRWENKEKGFIYDKTLAQLKACNLSSDELLKYECELKPLQQKINDNVFCLVYYSDLMTKFTKAQNFKMVKFCSEQITRIAESLEEDLK